MAEQGNAYVVRWRDAAERVLGSFGPAAVAMHAERAAYQAWTFEKTGLGGLVEVGALACGAQEYAEERGAEFPEGASPGGFGYRCARCGNDDHGHMNAAQKAWVILTIAEHEDGTPVLEYKELTGDFVGPVEIHCHECGHSWQQEELPEGGGNG